MGSCEKFLTAEQVKKLPIPVIQLENIMDNPVWFKKIHNERDRSCDRETCSENSSLGDETTEESDSGSDHDDCIFVSSSTGKDGLADAQSFQFLNRKPEDEDDLPRLVLVVDITEETTGSDFEINGPVSPEPFVVHVPKNSIKPDLSLVTKKESKIHFESETGNQPRDGDKERKEPSDRFWRIDSLVAIGDFSESLKLGRHPVTEDREKKDPEICSIYKSAPVQATNTCDDQLTRKSFNEVVAQNKLEVDSIENLWQDLTEIMKSEDVEESLPYHLIWPHLLHIWNPIENVVPDAETQFYFDAHLQRDQSLPLLDLTEADFPTADCSRSRVGYTTGSRPGSSARTVYDVAGMKDPLVEDNNEPPSASDSPPIVFTVSLENPKKSHGSRRDSQIFDGNVKPKHIRNSQQEALSWKAVEKMLQKQLKQVDRRIEPDRWAKLVKEWKKLQLLRQDDNNNNIVGAPALEKSR